MTTINRSALVPYSAQQMYHLVDHVDAYAEFLPWCKTAHEISRNEDEVTASITVAKGGVEKSFTTKNRLQKDKMIEMRLVEGPFHHLEGFWRFQKLDEEACKVSLDLEFEFSNALVKLAFGGVFNKIASTMVDAFVERAHQQYGNKS